MLYVAMTRAVHSLDMIIAPSKPNEKKWPKTYAGLLRSAMAPGQGAEPETTLYELGDAAWSDETGTGQSKVGVPALAGRNRLKAGLQQSANAASPIAVESLEIRLRPTAGRRRGLDYRTPSGLEGSGKVDLRRHLRLESVSGMTRGSILHAWFEQIQWLEDGVPSDDELIRIAAKFATPEIDLASEIKRFRAMLVRPAVATALRRSSYDDPAALGFPKTFCTELKSKDVVKRLKCEQAFVVREANSLVFGKADRIVYFYSGAKLLAADILDFKTDAVSTPAEIAERANFYRPQLAAYRSAVAAVTGLPPERISARLLFVEPSVIELVVDS